MASPAVAPYSSWHKVGRWVCHKVGARTVEMWMPPRVPLCVSAPAMARPQNTESADFRCSNGGVVASRKSDPKCDNEHRRMTQNCHWDLPTTEAMCRYLNGWHDSEDRVALVEQNPPHRLTIGNTDHPKTMKVKCRCASAEGHAPRSALSGQLGCPPGTCPVALTAKGPDLSPRHRGEAGCR